MDLRRGHILINTCSTQSLNRLVLYLEECRTLVARRVYVNCVHIFHCIKCESLWQVSIDITQLAEGATIRYNRAKYSKSLAGLLCQ